MAVLAVLAVLGIWFVVATAVALAVGRATAIADRRAPSSAARRRPTTARTPSAMRHMVAVVTGQMPIFRA